MKLLGLTLVLIGHTTFAQSDISEQAVQNRPPQSQEVTALEYVPYRNMQGAKGRPLAFISAGAPEYDSCLEAYKDAPRSTLIEHDALKIDYNGFHRVANWVYHEIAAENLRKPTMSRSNKFRADPKITNQTPVNERDYVRSGFDRGHLAPSGDFNWDRDLNIQTFYMSNMAPQTVSLNQRAWNALEGQVRSWACGLGKLKVYTGPVYDAGRLPHRLQSCVSVPHRFFKIVMAEKNGRPLAAGFVYEQGDDYSRGATGQWQEKITSIDEIETMTGIDFFSSLPVEVQAQFENQKSAADWESVGSEKCRSGGPQTQQESSEVP